MAQSGALRFACEKAPRPFEPSARIVRCQSIGCVIRRTVLVLSERVGFEKVLMAEEAFDDAAPLTPVAALMSDRAECDRISAASSCWLRMSAK